tara:strand:+ start:83 stop:403 length:321 start_codon:yes stop_codon:yes gene_type:complete
MGKRRRKRKGKGQRKPKLHYDDRGQFRWENYFVGGKQKRRKVRTVDGIDADEFWRQNADPIALLQAGEYHLLHELEQDMWPPTQASQVEQLELELEYIDADIDIPF